MPRPSKLPAHIHWPTDAEEAAIQRGIAADPDAREFTAAEIAEMRPVAEVDRELAAQPLRRRGPQKAETLEAVTLRLDRRVTEKLRDTGAGWQSRAARVLKEAVLGAAKGKTAGNSGEYRVRSGVSGKKGPSSASSVLSQPLGLDAGRRDASGRKVK